MEAQYFIVGRGVPRNWVCATLNQRYQGLRFVPTKGLRDRITATPCKRGNTVPMEVIRNVTSDVQLLVNAHKVLEAINA